MSLRPSHLIWNAKFFLSKISSYDISMPVLNLQSILIILVAPLCIGVVFGRVGHPWRGGVGAGTLSVRRVPLKWFRSSSVWLPAVHLVTNASKLSDNRTFAVVFAPIHCPQTYWGQRFINNNKLTSHFATWRKWYKWWVNSSIILKLLFL